MSIIRSVESSCYKSSTTAKLIYKGADSVMQTYTRAWLHVHTLNIAMNMCYITYISFSELGFKALHVQSGPCSLSLYYSTKAGRKKTQMLKLRDVHLEM